MTAPDPQLVRFGVFEADLSSGELRKSGRRVAIQEQPFKILARLLRHPGEVVTRDDLQNELWPADVHVDFERALNAAVKRLRVALGDPAESPRYIETLPKRGYRFIAPVAAPADAGHAPRVPAATPRWWQSGMIAAAIVTVAIVSIGAVWFVRASMRPATDLPGVLSRVTFDEGLQTEPTWSPDGRLLAYTSDRSGNFDIWVHPVEGGEPVRITSNPAQDWQPDWSPDGSSIVFRSERGNGGLFIVPALGGLERPLTPFGYQPRWSPDGRRILFAGTGLPSLNVFIGTGLSEVQVGIEDVATPLWIVDGAGGEPRRVFEEDAARFRGRIAAAWHPDGRVALAGAERGGGWALWLASIDGRPAVKSEISPPVAAAIEEAQLELVGDVLAWSPSGEALYLDGIVREVRSAWRFDVDPATLRWTGGPHRLTGGPYDETNLALSRDGSRLAFTSERRDERIWRFPIDAASGQARGDPVPVTAAGLGAFGPQLTADGQTLVFQVERHGGPHRHEIWTKSLADGREQLIRVDDIGKNASGLRLGIRPSPGGERISYAVMTPVDSFVGVHDVTSGTERRLTPPGPRDRVELAWNWTRDAAWIVGSGTRYTAGRSGLWLLPVSDRGRGVRIITTSDDRTIFHAAASPASDWIAFQTLSRGNANQSTLFCVPPSGGEWRALTDGTAWDGRPEWSADGRHVYFVSSRSGLLNVWGLRFDAARGEREGELFQVTRLEDPRRRIYPAVAWTEIAASRDAIFAPVMELTGNVWMLDRINR